MANFGKRPQQYRLTYPLSKEQVENIDSMFETLFKRIGQVQMLAESIAPTSSPVPALSSLMAMEKEDSEPPYIVPGPPGPPGKDALLAAAAAMLALPLDSLEDPHMLIPGPKGDKGDRGDAAAALAGLFHDLGSVQGSEAPMLGLDTSPFAQVNNANTWTETQTFNGAISAGGISTFANLVASAGFVPFDLQIGQIKFPATQNPSSDANTLDDYEEGNWTPNDASGASLTFTSVTGQYIKIGKLVAAAFILTYPATASGANAVVGGLPFTVDASSAYAWAGVPGVNTSANLLSWIANPSSTQLLPRIQPGNTIPTNANLSLAVLTCVALYKASA